MMLDCISVDKIVVRILVGMLMFCTGCGAPSNLAQGNASHGQNSLNQVPVSYLIGPGDELGITYHMNPNVLDKRYVIGIGDTLKVEFYNFPNLTRSLKVRPDGYITLPLIGDIIANNRTPEQLASMINGRYQSKLKYPDVTVEVVDFYAGLDNLKKLVTTADYGQTLRTTVRPDGYISLPYLDEIKAAGLTAHEFTKELRKKYSSLINGVDLTIDILRVKSNLVYIMGQVNRPNFYELTTPTTATQLVAMAGGFTGDANMNLVVLISSDNEKKAFARSIDMEEIVEDGDIGADVLLKQYDIIYVPRTGMAKAALFSDQLWRIVPLRFTVSGIVYSVVKSED